MNAIANMVRLTKAGAVIAWSGARVLPDELRLPPPLALFGRLTAPLRKDKANGTGHDVANEARLSTALTSLGPSYIKLGQFLATRDDIIGRELAADLSTLQDRLPPFSQDEARKAVEDALEAPIDTLFAEFGPPVAAASIAQVHKASVREPGGALKPVAVKVLRPGIEQRFNKDLDFIFLRRAHDRAVSSALAPAPPAGRGGDAGEIRRHRDGSAHGGRRHLRDGRELQERRRLSRAERRLEPERAARADA